MATPEHAWLIAVLRAHTRAEMGVAPPASWPAALALAEREGLESAVAFAFRDVPAPDDVRRRLEARVRDHLARHLLMTEALAGVLRVFRADGIDALVLKGPVLAETLYPHPALRPYSDLDLLIRPEQVERADARLRAAGWQRSPDAHSWEYDVAYDGQTVYAGPRGVRLDLHWRLFNHAGAGTPDPGIWSRAMTVTIGGEDARGLAREDLLLFLGAHLVLHHEAVGLRWQWDLAQLLAHHGQRLAWDAVATRARAQRIATAVWMALVVVERAFGIPAPGGRRVAPGPARRALVRRLAARAAAGTTFGRLAAFLLLDGAHARWTVVRRALCPAPRWVRLRYGGRTLAAYVTHYRWLARSADA